MMKTNDGYKRTQREGGMQQGLRKQDWSWLTTTSRILHERPERLQHLVMQIADKYPEMGCYASDIARLRMSGIVMENLLFMLWKADSSRQVDSILDQSFQFEHPCTGALSVLADLIKQDLTSQQSTGATVH